MNKMSWRWFLKAFSSLLAAACIAFISLWFVLNRELGTVKKGEWKTDQTTGSARAGMYRRARVAASGIWALQSSEVVYYSAETDSDGNPLRHDANYRIVGTDPDARWWSVAAYKNDHLIANPLNRYSFSKTTVERESDGGWKIYLSPKARDKNWLPSGDGPGKLTVLLRNYNPSRQMIEAPDRVELPQLVKEPSQ